MAWVQNVSEFVLSFLAVYYLLVPMLFTKEPGYEEVINTKLVEVTSFYQQILSTNTNRYPNQK